MTRGDEDIDRIGFLERRAREQDTAFFATLSPSFIASMIKLCMASWRYASSGYVDTDELDPAINEFVAEHHKIPLPKSASFRELLIVRDHRSGASLRQLAARYGSSHETIRQLVRSRRVAREHSVTEGR